MTMTPEAAAAPKSDKPKRSFNIQLTQKHIKRAELVHLSRQLAAFLRAGISLLAALEVLRADGESATVREVAGQIADDLVSGMTLTDAVELHPKDFPLFYRRMLRSAEVTGRLDDVLDQLAAYLERDLEARQKVTSAMMYPAIVAGLAVVVIVILSVAVLPRFQVFFASLNAKLPLPTRMLLNFSHFMGSYGVILFGVIIVLAIGLFYWTTKPKGKIIRDRVILRTPLFGPVVHLALLERFCRLQASMIRAGVGLLAALKVTADALGNSVYRTAIEDVSASLIQGTGLTTAISATGLFPATVTQMIRVGEETGSLATQLDLSADFYASELDYKLKKLTTLVEPAVVIGVGIAVGFVAIALISAMYGIFRQVK